MSHSSENDRVNESGCAAWDGLSPAWRRALMLGRDIEVGLPDSYARYVASFGSYELFVETVEAVADQPEPDSTPEAVAPSADASTKVDQNEVCIRNGNWFVAVRRGA